MDDGEQPDSSMVGAALEIAIGRSCRSAASIPGLYGEVRAKVVDCT
jgi:hypothetical protein